MNYLISQTKNSQDYALLDSGEGEKLERYGDVIISRPDPQALWKKRLPESEWKKANAWFGKPHVTANPSASPLGKGGERGGWGTRGSVPERWPIGFSGLKFWIKLSAFKHTGLFPEQAGNWDWLRPVILSRAKDPSSRTKRDSSVPQNDSEKVNVLNLFGYTGGATLACAQVGAEVVHVDGSKVAIGWARDNAELSGLKDKPVRWILDDAVAFVKREIKRGHKYDGIIMDPPAFGHGPGGELWKIEDNFINLVDLCGEVLSDRPLFFLINGYASGYSALAYKNNLDELQKKFGGKIEVGELTIAESEGERLLPCGIFARWSSV